MIEKINMIMWKQLFNGVNFSKEKKSTPFDLKLTR